MILGHHGLPGYRILPPLLDVLRPVNHEGSYQVETKRIPTNSLLKTHSTIEYLEKFGENEVE